MGMVMIMRCTCDNCEVVEESEYKHNIPKGWGYVQLIRIPGYRFNSALLCRACIQPCSPRQSSCSRPIHETERGP
jgi:hypothetical protein